MPPAARSPLDAIARNVDMRASALSAVEKLALEADATALSPIDVARAPRVETTRAREDDATARESDANAREDDAREDDAREDDADEASTATTEYRETVALLRAQTTALREANEAREELEEALREAETTKATLEGDALERMRAVRGEMESLRATLEEVVESRRRAREGEANAVARAKASEETLARERESHERAVEEMRAELALARSSAEIAARGVRTKDGVEVTAELYEQSHSMEKKALKDARRAKNALVEQKKTLEALEKRLRDTRSRADLAEAKCRELKSAQKRWDRLEAGGDNAFAQSPASAATPRTLRQSHRDVRAYAAQRVEALEKDVKTTRREATLATADLDSKLAAESGTRSAVQGSLESARARIRVLEGERDALRARAEAAETEVADLKMTLKLTEERAAQAEETAAKEIAAAMDAMHRVHSAEDALMSASHEQEEAVKAKSAMKRREYGEKTRELEERIEAAERARDAAAQRAQVAEDARRRAESELARAQTSTARDGDGADVRERIRAAEDRALRAEEELSQVRKAARDAARNANESISPSPERVAHRPPFSQSRPTRLARERDGQRAAAAELLHSLRAKLEASSPSIGQKSKSRFTDADHDDASYATPVKRA